MMEWIQHFDLKGRKKIWWILFFTFLILFVYGSLYEISDIWLENIRPLNETGQCYVMLLFSFCLVLIYFVPFCIFLKWTCRKLKVSLMLPVMAFFSGWFVPGWMAGDLNDNATVLEKHLFPAWFVSMWGDGIEAPFIEETLKVLVVVSLLYLIGKRERKHYLIAGMSVGMGFQVGEDFNYIENAIVGSHKNFMNIIPFTLTNRVEGAITSHWCLTALMTVGVYLFFHEKKRKSGILLMICALLTHAVSDTVLTNTILIGLPLPMPITGAIELYVFCKVYMDTFHKEIPEI